MPTVFPSLMYRDCPAAMVWLHEVLGFTEHAVYKDDQGQIMHAEMRFGNGMIMLGSKKAPGSLWDDIGPSSVYLTAPDAAAVDTAYARAETHSGEIVSPLKDQDYGSHEFTVKDPEGNMWSIGTYAPGA